MRIRCERMFIIPVIRYWRKVLMDCLMMSCKATSSFALQETFRTGVGRMQTRWISHTVKTESVDMRLETDLSIFAAHTTTQTNICVPPKKKTPQTQTNPPLSFPYSVPAAIPLYTFHSLYYTIIFHSLPFAKKPCPLKPNFAHKCQNHIPPPRWSRDGLFVPMP